MRHKPSPPAGEASAPLWTRDFTIITLGSVVSMLGNAMSGFALSLLVLDYTDDSLLYAVYIAAFTVPQIVMPILSGAILDRFSRKRTIYTLDFVSAGIYALAAVILGTGYFSFPVLAVFCLVIGSVNSVYSVAYESFYPLLISPGNFSKAYSISSVLHTLAGLIVPVATYFYKLLGIAPLMAVNAVCFLAAAVAETRIQAGEDYIETRQAALGRERVSARQLLRDIREGFSYLLGERGLLCVAVYFAFSSFASGASSVITLPYFKRTFSNGEYVYMIVWGMSIVGRAIGGSIHYRTRLPVHRKYAIALAVYIIIHLCEGTYLYFPIPVMMASCFLTGILGVTSYTIRISATQSYVPSEKKGRFNGAFNMLNTVGTLSGELLSGALAAVFPPRAVLTGVMALTALSAVVIIGGGRRPVSAIYNRQQ